MREDENRHLGHVEYVPVSRPTRLPSDSDDNPTVRAELVSGVTRLKVVDNDEVVLDLTMVESLNLAIELIEKAGTVAANVVQGSA